MSRAVLASPVLLFLACSTGGSQMDAERLNHHLRFGGVLRAWESRATGLLGLVDAAIARLDGGPGSS